MLTELVLHSILLLKGYTQPQAQLLTCIAKQESTLKPTAIHKNTNKTKDYGLFQINTIWLGRCLYNTRQILSIDNNIECAKLVIEKQGLQAWSTYSICKEI